MQTVSYTVRRKNGYGDALQNDDQKNGSEYMTDNQKEQDVIEIDLMELLMQFLHRWWVIAAAGLVCGVTAFLLSAFILPKEYESTTSIYILDKKDDSTITTADIQLGTQMTKDYAEIIKSRTVLDRVAEEYGLDITYDKFCDRISVSTQTDTRIVSISVRDRDPSLAKDLADALRNVASERITGIIETNAVNIVDEADIPEEPASPKVLVWTLVGLLLGIFVSAAVIAARYLMDDTVKTGDDVERYLGLSTLGMIPENEAADEGRSGHKKSAGRHKKGGLKAPEYPTADE